MNAQHSSKSFEHYTPAPFVEAARATMGGIDLDPASCEQAQQTVRALIWYGLPKDGLIDEPWVGRVFLNPPGGLLVPHRKSKNDPKIEPDPKDIQTRATLKTNSRAVAWWRRLVCEFGQKNVTEAIFIAFSLEILQQAQGLDGIPGPAVFPMCIPSKRIAFDGNTKNQPTHANAIVYLGPNVERFAECFDQFGDLVNCDPPMPFG